MKRAFNIYMCGVGGQGIGMLSEVLTRACMDAGHPVHGCDTHGLAQRGGTVVSHLRLGDGVHTPLVPPGEADLVVALERLEAQRAAATMLRPGGTVVYYETSYQPIHVRMGQAEYPGEDTLRAEVESRGGKLSPVKLEDIPDPRMQNVALLGRLAGLDLIEGLDSARLTKALEATLPPAALEANMTVFAGAAD